MIHYILWALETLFLCLVAVLAVVALCVTAGRVRDAINRCRAINQFIEQLVQEGQAILLAERIRRMVGRDWEGKRGYF